MVVLIIPFEMSDEIQSTNITLLVDKSQSQFLQTIEPILSQSLLSIEREITGNDPMFNSPKSYLTKVFIQIFLRNKQYIIFSLILPIVILSIVGLSDGEADPVDIGLVNNSESKLSVEFINQLSANTHFDVI